MVLLIVFISFCPAIAGEIIHEVHPDVKMDVPEPPRLGLIRPSINIYKVSAGGVSEKVEAWCDTACENIRAAVEETFEGNIKIIPINQFEPTSALDVEMLELQALYDTVTMTISNTWLGQFAFPKEYRKFDYSLGDAGDLFDSLEVDALIFVTGSDQIKTGGRKTMEFVSFLAGVVYFKSAYLDVGLVGRSGKLLWYKLMGSLPKTDLREPEGAKAYVDAAFKGFPLK
jgi:hypothetical protein